MKSDLRGARYDAEVEAIDERLRQAHEDSECGGIPRCGYCLDELEETLVARQKEYE